MMSLSLAGNCTDQILMHVTSPKGRERIHRTWKPDWVPDGGVRPVSISDYAKRMAASKQARQSLLFFFSQIGNAFLGIVLYGLLARALSVEDFGSYTFVTAFVAFTIYFFDFGLSSSAMRLMALAEPGEAMRERLGALLLSALAVGIAYALFFLLSAFVIERFFPGNLGRLFVALSPLAAVYPVQEILLAIGQGGNRVRFLSAFSVLPRLMLCLAIVVLSFYGEVTLTTSLLLTMATIILAVGLAWWHLKPLYSRVRSEIGAVIREMREFGRHVYTGRIIDGMTNGTDRMMISHVHGMAPQGYYSIAKTLSMPISLMSRSISTISYQRFATDPRICRSVLLLNVAWCVGMGTVLLIGCEMFVPMFFTARYADSLAVLPWLVAAAMISGLNAPYHSFLAAKRQGRAIKNMSVTTSLLNVVLTLALVPFLSMVGAAIAWIVSASLNIIMNLHYYRQYLAMHTAVETI